MTDYTHDPIFAADWSNPQLVASNGVITLFAPGDATKTPIPLKTVDGLPMANPYPVNKLGMGPAYICTLWEVAWEGGGLSGLFRSTIGLRNEAVQAVSAAQDAQAAAEGAAATAGAEAAAAASAALAGAVADADAAKTSADDSAAAAAASAALVGAPADTAVQTLVSASGSGTRAAFKQAMADIAGDPASAFRTVQNATYVVRGEVVINAKDYLPGAANDTVAINAAMTAAYDSYVATGSPATVFVPPKAGGWQIVRRTVGSADGGGIKMRRGVDLIGNRTKLVIADNCHFIYAISATGAPVTITANTVATDTTLTVASSTGIAVGNDVLVRIGQAAYDAFEPDWWTIAKVTAVTGTTVTLDRPVGYALTAASVTNTENRSIRVITEYLEGNVIRGFEMINPMTTGNAECGITVGTASNISIADITSVDAGAGIVCSQFATNLTIDNARVRSAKAQNGQLSKGRAFNFAESHGVIVNNAFAQNFDNSFATVEAGCSGVVFNSPRIINNAAGRSSGKSLFEVLGKGSCVVESPMISGNPCVINYSSQSLVRNPTFRMAGALPIINDLTQLQGNVQVGDSVYREVRKFTLSFPLTPSTTNKLIPLGNGLIRRLRVYATSTTGVTAFGVGNTTSGAQSMNATAGQWVEVNLAKGLGSGYPVNNYDAKQIYFTTDATTPAGNYAVVEVEIQVPDADTGITPVPSLDLARVPTGTDGLVLTADSSKPSGLGWASGGAPSAHAASHRAGGTDDLILYGAHTVPALTEPWPRWAVNGKVTVGNGTVVFSYFTADHSAVISNLTIHSGSTATVGATLVRLGLFSVDGAGNLTLVARTDSDTAVLSGTNAGYTRALSTVGGFPASYTLTPGTRYAFGLIVVGSTTQGQYWGLNSSGSLLYSTSPKMAAALSAQTDLPTGQITVGSLSQHGAPAYIAGT